LWVITLKTPGIFSASDVSMLTTLAWETLAWTRASLRVSAGIFKAKSAPKSHVPVALYMALGRG
jgi:hypothetical protein